MKKLTFTLAAFVFFTSVNAANQTVKDTLNKKVENLEKTVAQQQQEIKELKKTSATKQKDNSKKETFVIDRRGSKQWYKKP
jgi:hypothetical protein